MCDVDWSWIQTRYYKNGDDICYDTVTNKCSRTGFVLILVITIQMC